MYINPDGTLKIINGHPKRDLVAGQWMRAQYHFVSVSRSRDLKTLSVIFYRPACKESDFPKGPPLRFRLNWLTIGWRSHAHSSEPARVPRALVTLLFRA